MYGYAGQSHKIIIHFFISSVPTYLYKKATHFLSSTSYIIFLCCFMQTEKVLTTTFRLTGPQSFFFSLLSGFKELKPVCSQLISCHTTQKNVACIKMTWSSIRHFFLARKTTKVCSITEPFNIEQCCIIHADIAIMGTPLFKWVCSNMLIKLFNEKKIIETTGNKH